MFRYRSRKDMNCPECGNNAVPFIRAWLIGPWFHFDCPRCHTKLKVHKIGLGRFSSYIISVPIGVLIVLGMWDVYRSLPVFVLVTAVLLMLDFLIDSKFIILEKTSCKNMEEPTVKKSVGGDA
jgi:hypothetical protein